MTLMILSMPLILSDMDSKTNENSHASGEGGYTSEGGWDHNDNSEDDVGNSGVWARE